MPKILLPLLLKLNSSLKPIFYKEPDDYKIIRRLNNINFTLNIRNPTNKDLTNLVLFRYNLTSNAISKDIKNCILKS